MTKELQILAEEALEYLKKASKGRKATPKNHFEPGIRRGKEHEILADKAKKAMGLLDDLHRRKQYTVCTELALYSIERLTEAAVIKKYITARKKEHGRIFEEASDLGIMDKELAAYLSRMFRYRGELYYREGVSTREVSAKMMELAKGVEVILKQHSKA
jgi:hypothetical protein